MRFLLLFAILLCASTLFAERYPLSRYEAFIARHMFGQPPAGFDPTKLASEVSTKEEKEKAAKRAEAEAKIKRNIRFSSINVTPDGSTAVGFTDMSAQNNPKNYYFKVGDTRDGWKVTAADPLADQPTMTLVNVNEGIEVTLKLGEDSSKEGVSKLGSAASAAKPAADTGVSALLADEKPHWGASRYKRHREEIENLKIENKKLEAMYAADKESERKKQEEDKKRQDEQTAEIKSTLESFFDKIRKERPSDEEKKPDEAKTTETQNQEEPQNQEGEPES